MRESCQTCFAAELGVIVGNLIWKKTGRRKNLQAVYLVFWQAWPMDYQGLSMTLTFLILKTDV